MLCLYFDGGTCIYQFCILLVSTVLFYCNPIVSAKLSDISITEFLVHGIWLGQAVLNYTQGSCTGCSLPIYLLHKDAMNSWKMPKKCCCNLSLASSTICGKKGGLTGSAGC